MNTIIIGIGNPILSDDGAGPRVAAELKDLSGRNGIVVKEANTEGLGLLDLLAGHDRAIIIDAIQTADGKAGHIDQFDLKALRSSQRTGIAHDFNLAAAMKLGKQLGIKLPGQIDIFAIEANDVSTFDEKCTPEVEKAIPICAGIIRQELARRGKQKKQTIEVNLTTSRNLDILDPMFISNGEPAMRNRAIATVGEA